MGVGVVDGDGVNKESNDRLKCQIYPSMQLGGSPPQLFDQVKDGVADIVWTLPTYQAGRFTKSEVFELPFTMTNWPGTATEGDTLGALAASALDDRTL